MTNDARATAADRLADLLTVPAPDLGGFLDTMGDVEDTVTGPAQWLMRTPVLPTVYERYWRPALGRLLKGPFGPTMAGEVRRAVQALDLRPGGIALDVACGTGRFTRAFAGAVGPYGLAIGLDSSVSMLRRAVADTPRNAQLAYLRADAVRPPLRESTVDAVCCFAALHMFADPAAALASFARLLVPDGRIVLLTSARHSWEPASTVETLAGALSGQRMFGRDEIAELLCAAGFTDITVAVTGLAQLVSARLG